MDRTLLADTTDATAADRAAEVVPGSAGGASGHARQAAETVRLYASDWAGFLAWCRERRLAALPSSPATVAAYLGSLSATLQHGALARRAAAIADQHRRVGFPSPGSDPAVRDVLRVARLARRSANQASQAAGGRPLPAIKVRRRLPPGPVQLIRMAARCPGDLAGLRDRALLLLTACGLGGERLLALDREHVRFTGHEMTLLVPGPQHGAGEVIVLARMASSAACPVHAMQGWLHSSDTRFGPVFRKVDRWGGVEHRRLRADALRRIWQRRAKAVRMPRAAARAAG